MSPRPARWRKGRHEPSSGERDRGEGKSDEVPPRPAPGPQAPGGPAPWHVPVLLDPELVVRAARRAVARALAEDLGVEGDLTTQACVPAGTYGAADIVARGDGVVAGLAAIAETFSQVDGRIDVRALVEDGDRIPEGGVVARVQGPLRSILTAERTALNLLGHLCGIATITRAFVDAVADTGCVVRDTRKTMPGMRLLEKAAVVAGGGVNHRLSLGDALLVKGEHVVAAGGVGPATRSALTRAGERPVQVEVRSLREVDEALAAGATDLLLDNVSPEDVRRAVAAVAGRAAVETSGGITLANVRAYAEAGADRVAVGALTHSAPWLDVALELDPASLRFGSDDEGHETAAEVVSGEQAAALSDIQPHQDEPLLLAPEPDPAAGPATLAEDVREPSLSEAAGGTDEPLLDEEESQTDDEASDGRGEARG